MDSIENIFWGEFIELYESMPCLWKVKSPEYSNRDLKSRCYAKMVEKMKEIDPDASREKVVKKINVFRTNYKRAVRKIQNSEQSGAEHVYETKLWYFDKLKFLEDEECSRNVTADPKTILKVESADDPLELPYVSASPTPKKRKVIVTKNIAVEEKITKIDCKKSRRTDDATSILAEGWATQYEELSKAQQIFTRTIFADVLFHGSLDKLTEEIVENVHKALKGTTTLPNITIHNDFPTPCL